MGLGGAIGAGLGGAAQWAAGKYGGGGGTGGGSDFWGGSGPSAAYQDYRKGEQGY